MILHHSCLKTLLLIAIISIPYSFYAQSDIHRIVLQKGIPLSEQIKQENTTYIIKHKFKLAEDVFIPKGSVLELKGGSISSNNNRVRLRGDNIVRNGKFINTGISIDGENVIIERNSFTITSKNNIGYGVIGSDAFGGSVIIRDNKITNTTQFGTITLCLPSWKRHANVCIENNIVTFSQIGITINARPRQLGIDSVRISNNSITLHNPKSYTIAKKQMWGMAVSLERDIDYADVSNNYIEGCIGVELAGTNNADITGNTIKVFGTDTYMKRGFGIYQSDESFYIGGKIRITNNNIYVEKKKWKSGGDIGTIYISFAQNHNYTISDNKLIGGQIKLVQARNYIENNKNTIFFSRNNIESHEEKPLVFGMQDRGNIILYNILFEHNIIHSNSASTFVYCYNTNYTGRANQFFTNMKEKQSSKILFLSPTSYGHEEDCQK